ncbi:MAG: ATP-binding cassette domain-containing protein [Clostridiales bacterium]|nr:ATP-binding cassette domain-containing protein [Clostridiales bacterium]
MLELNNITKIFNKDTVNEATVFNNFNLTVEEGEFVSIVGSNGSGKTTLLNIISGNIPIEYGSVILKGNDITKQPEYIRARRIGRVFQDPSKGTANTMTIAENLALAENKGNPYGLSRGLNKKKIEEYRELVRTLNLGLEDKINVEVGSLSGGQRQALTLLMATMTPIDLLLLDEHTAALDPKTSQDIMDLTNRIVTEKHITTLMVTHNLRFAVEYGSRLMMFNKGTAVIDKAGEDKQKLVVDDLLKTFNEISIECGN